MKTILGLFSNAGDAESAVQELTASGWKHKDIGVLTPQQTTNNGPEVNITVRDAEKGATIGGFAGLLLGLSELTVPGVGPLLAGGWLMTTLLGAGVGAATGGLVGLLTAAGMSHETAASVIAGVHQGRTLVTIRTVEDKIPQAEALLMRHGAATIQERDS